MCGGAHLPLNAYSSHWTAFKSHFSPFTSWVTGLDSAQQVWWQAQIPTQPSDHSMLLGAIYKSHWFHIAFSVELFLWPKGGSLFLSSLFFIGYPLTWLSCLFCIFLRRENHLVFTAQVLLAGLFIVDWWISEFNTSASSMTITSLLPCEVFYCLG